MVLQELKEKDAYTTDSNKQTIKCSKFQGFRIKMTEVFTIINNIILA